MGDWLVHWYTAFNGVTIDDCDRTHLDATAAVDAYIEGANGPIDLLGDRDAPLQRGEWTVRNITKSYTTYDALKAMVGQRGELERTRDDGLVTTKTARLMDIRMSRSPINQNAAHWDATFASAQDVWNGDLQSISVALGTSTTVIIPNAGNMTVRDVSFLIWITNGSVSQIKIKGPYTTITKGTFTYSPDPALVAGTWRNGVAINSGAYRVAPYNGPFGFIVADDLTTFEPATDRIPLIEIEPGGSTFIIELSGSGTIAGELSTGFNDAWA